ncbi:MAG: Fic family protein [Planctomycetes bacterium]|nr:Fic family protein [Planctomycetota bacterium]
MEGNRLSPNQVQSVIEGEGNFPGRERDEAEVRNYFAALGYVEQIGKTFTRLKETEVRTIHGLVMSGKAKATRYRNQQNVIRESLSGRIIYLPPEAKDVTSLMKELVSWVNQSIDEGDLPIPVVVALAHYQLATIHPYLDGNGRLARLLSNLLLHRHGYGMNGIYSLEEYYSSNLDGYYSSLNVGPSHNYYFGRREADVTPFVTYFCLGMAEAFANVRIRAVEASQFGTVNHSDKLRELSPQQRSVLSLFLNSKEVTRNDVAKYFSLSARQAYLLCSRWLKSGFFVVANSSTKGRSYRLANAYEGLVVEKTSSKFDSN